MTMMKRGWMATLLLAACAAPDAPPADAAQADTPPPPAAAAESTSAAQPVDPAPPPAAPAQQDTGYTAWRMLDWPSEPWEQRAATPEALLQRVRDVVAAQLEEPDASVLPTRMEAQQADSAIGVLVHPDQADDSVRDVEFRLHMRREGAEWAVAGVERRERCRRGVASGGLCA
jgi:hypothetical protein